MALSPGIPTSFVPRQPIQATNRRAFLGGDNLFLIGTLIVAGISVILSISLFAYDRYLASTLQDKMAELETAKTEVNQKEIENFVQLSDRMKNVREVLNNHIVLSDFLTVFEGLTLQNVRFASLDLTVAADRSVKAEMAGTAKNFNTLAAQSNTLATEKNIRRAIFSGITLNPLNNTVGFKLSAEIDPKIVVLSSTNVPANTVDPLTLPSTTVTPPPTTTGALAPALGDVIATGTPTTSTSGTGTTGTSTPKAKVILPLGI